MRTLNNNTKQALDMVHSYNYARSNGNYSIYDAYVRPSQNKVDAFKWCEQLKEQLNGKYACIPSFNTFNFTYAFEYLNELQQICLAYITKDNIYSIILNDTKGCILP